MSSELMWLLGIAMIAAALGILWNRRMSSIAQATEASQYEDVESEVAPVRYQAMPGLTPITPVLDLSLGVKSQAPVAATKPAPEAVEQKTGGEGGVDTSEMDLLITLATQLNDAGDHEGAAEFADMVLEDDRATGEQKARAHALFRRESIA